MAGWTNSTGTGSGGGRGSGGRGFTPFTPRLNPSLFNHGGTSAGAGAGPGPGPGPGPSGGGGGRSRGRPPQQPHYRYRRVDAVDREPPLVPQSERQAASFDDVPELDFRAPSPVFHREIPPRVPLPEHQAASSTSSSRRARRTRPTSTMDKSSASGTVAPPSTRETDDKANRNAANFECNVCFDMAAEPVVTKCGHLFCWECLYQWLHVHSHHRECPVCKGQVAEDAIIPIYGRGGSAASVNKAPPRPTGARVESSRQQQQQRTSLPPRLFDFPRLSNNFPRLSSMSYSSFREAIMHIMSPTIEDMEMDRSDALMDQSDAFSYFDDGEFYPEVNEFDMEVDPYGDFELYESGFALGGATEVSNHSSSQAHADMINHRDNTVGTTNGGYHHQEFGYSGARPNNNRGRRGRRNRTRVSADHLSNDEPVMVTQSSSGFIHSNNGGGSSNVSAGAALRPNGGWTERRGRSNRNSNSGGGRRGVQDSRRQRTNYYN